MDDTPVCKFNPHQWPYIFNSSGYSQSPCPKCGLWTVYTHEKTGSAFSQCVGGPKEWNEFEEKNK